MTEIDKLKLYITTKMDISKKNIMLQSVFNTYRKTIEYIALGLINTKKYNIIIIYDEPNGSAIESLECSFFIPSSSHGSLNFIDLVVIDDHHGNEFIDTQWMAEKAPRLFLTHDILIGYYKKNIKYNFIPSKMAFENIKAEDNIDNIFIKGGYPKLDISIEEYSTYKKNNLGIEDSILYCPSARNIDGFGKVEYMQNHIHEYNYSIGFDYHIIKMLLDNFEENIILRPHPYHSKRNHPYILKLMNKFKNESRVIWSKDYYINDYARSKFIISDLSQTIYTYSFTTLKPVISFISSNIQESHISNDMANNIGHRVRTLNELIEKSNDILSNLTKYSKKIERFRKENIYNVGNSFKTLEQNIDEIVNLSKKL